MKHDFQELRLDHVTRRFAAAGGVAFSAVNELTITIRRGEFIALLGPSGCGKSTALNCIAGLLPLSSGSIWLDDVRIDTLPPERRGFGMVFQNYALFPHMSVERNVSFGLRMRGVHASEVGPRVARALKLVQLVGQERKLPGQLSGGQQQRVAIARAIVIEPPLILMDEPLSNLDAKLRLETRSEIRRIHRELDRATIYVTHDQDEALSLADRIVVIENGTVQQIASPHEVYAQPANLSVARFMGYRNVLGLDIEREDGDRVTLASGDIRLTGLRKQPLADRRACVAMRPEELVIGEGPGGANTIVGRVDNVEYGGRDSLVDVVTRSGAVLHVRSHAPVTLGEEIRVHVPAERALVYPADRAP
jgi:putative spermidine/putrescine transport system ATP-binding protein